MRSKRLTALRGSVRSQSQMTGPSLNALEAPDCFAGASNLTAYADCRKGLNALEAPDCFAGRGQA